MEVPLQVRYCVRCWLTENRGLEEEGHPTTNHDTKNRQSALVLVWAELWTRTAAGWRGEELYCRPRTSLMTLGGSTSPPHLAVIKIHRREPGVGYRGSIRTGGRGPQSGAGALRGSIYWLSASLLILLPPCWILECFLSAIFVSGFESKLKSKIQCSQFLRYLPAIYGPASI